VIPVDKGGCTSWEALMKLQKRLQLSLLSIICRLPCSAQEPRWVYPVPDAGTYTKIEATYKAVDSSLLMLDLVRPAAVTTGQRYPVLVIFNGFGGSFLRTSSQAQSWAKAATAHGFAAVTEDTTPGHIAEDFDSLTTYLLQHADDLHVDPERIAVIAWSGAVTSGLPIIEDPERKSIKAAVIYYGHAPIKQVRLDLPVLYVRAGLDEATGNQEIDLVTSYAVSANAPWTILNYSSGHHGFDTWDDNDASREVIERTFQFLQAAVSASYQTALRSGLPEASAAGAMRTGDYERAVALYGILAQSRSQDARILLAYGNALVGANRYREARVQFDRVKAIGTAGPRDLGIPAAKACVLDNDSDAAIAWLKTIPSEFLPASVQSDVVFASLKNRRDFQALFRGR
jgi:dienelactone hydrolase